MKEWCRLGCCITPWMTITWRRIGDIDGNINVSFADSFCSSKQCHPIVSSLGSLDLEFELLCVQYTSDSGYSPWFEKLHVPVHYHHSSLLTLRHLLSIHQLTPNNQWITHSPVGHWLFSLHIGWHSNNPYGYLFAGSTSIHQSISCKKILRTWSVPIPSTPMSLLWVIQQVHHSPVLLLGGQTVKGYATKSNTELLRADCHCSAHKDSREPMLTWYDHLKAKR